MSTQKRKYELKARADAQQATRERIAAAAVSLHEEVGFAKTTVADIARRAGVQRLTVYNHFPDLDALLPACTAHWNAEHPMPDLAPAFALPDPQERLRAALTLLYGWYRETAAMQRRVLGERATVPELDAWMARSGDQALDQLTTALAAGLNRPLVALALSFWTWERLTREGLDDDAAAKLMAAVAPPLNVNCAGKGSGRQVAVTVNRSPAPGPGRGVAALSKPMATKSRPPLPSERGDDRP